MLYQRFKINGLKCGIITANSHMNYWPQSSSEATSVLVWFLLPFQYRVILFLVSPGIRPFKIRYCLNVQEEFFFFLTSSLTNTSALSINDLYPRVKCSWHLLLNSQNPTSIFRPKVTEPTGIKNYKATHTYKKCGMLPTSNTVHRERNTKHRKTTLYSGFSRYYSENTFSLFFPPLSSCLFIGLRVFEGV